MKNAWLLLPLVSLLTACLNSTVRGYTAQAMPGLTSPFTTDCTALRLVVGNIDTTLDQSETRRVFTSHPNPGPTTITAYCLAMKNGVLTEMGRSQVNVKPNTLNVYIGSSEGSTAADAFTKTATVSGVFPIIQAE
ncbi:hypothetical protein GCM10010914_30720 [Deinococcus wulumuqiensis]|uniref:Lipoprotein n=2 Tax=Deinococcaceae TaxID=183710 RepID=A0AAV4KA59_9DEIO|nr:hypothetical protein GCM10008021_30030 [Deinococcus wulumuqiensis]GGI93966.1 hypothetical protein GCM10010914_30720 [Deinococcus wulumuqiensis]